MAASIRSYSLEKEMSDEALEKAAFEAAAVAAAEKKALKDWRPPHYKYVICYLSRFRISNALRSAPSNDDIAMQTNA